MCVYLGIKNAGRRPMKKFSTQDMQAPKSKLDFEIQDPSWELWKTRLGELCQEQNVKLEDYNLVYFTQQNSEQPVDNIDSEADWRNALVVMAKAGIKKHVFGFQLLPVNMKELNKPPKPPAGRQRKTVSNSSKIVNPKKRSASDLIGDRDIGDKDDKRKKRRFQGGEKPEEPDEVAEADIPAGSRSRTALKLVKLGRLKAEDDVQKYASDDDDRHMSGSEKADDSDDLDSGDESDAARELDGDGHAEDDGDDGNGERARRTAK